jgi:hypothetical protein
VSVHPRDEPLAPDELLAWLGEGAERLRTIAEISSTVDLERALAEFHMGWKTVEPGVADPLEAVEDPLLGARVVVLTTTDGRRFALAEPSTEGRLAAALARHGEANVGAYLEAPFGLDVVEARAAAAHVRLSRVETGPFGRSVLVLPGKLAGQHLILVERSAVPSPP